MPGSKTGIAGSRHTWYTEQPHRSCAVWRCRLVRLLWDMMGYFGGGCREREGFGMPIDGIEPSAQVGSRTQTHALEWHRTDGAKQGRHGNVDFGTLQKHTHTHTLFCEWDSTTFLGRCGYYVDTSPTSAKS